MTTKLLAALASLTLLACGTPIVPAGEDLSTSSREELKATSTRKTTAVWSVQLADSNVNPIFKTSFPIATTYDLYAAFDIPVALSGTHVAAFEFISPDGAVYQRNEVPFTPGSAKSYRVWSSLPVAGTWIQQFMLVGSWKVQVFLDGETAPRASRAFSFQ